MKLSPQEQRAENGRQRERDGRRAGHRKGLGKRQWMKELAFLSGEREHWNKGENDDGHGEKGWAADQLRRAEHGLQNFSSVVRIYAFEMPEGVFRNHNAGVDEHSDGNRNSCE